MALPATDTFTQAGAGAGALDASWTTISGEGAPVVDQPLDVARITSVGVDAGAYWNADSFNADQYAQLKAVAATSSSLTYISAVLRCAAAARTYYAVGVFGALGGSVTYELYRRSAGVKTTLGATGTTTVNVNDIIYAEVSGTTITLKVNGVTIATRTDANIASGSAGFFLFVDGGTVNDAEIDDWEGGNLSAAAAQVPYQPQYQMAPVMAQ